jgi:hypothetical protein
MRSLSVLFNPEARSNAFIEHAPPVVLGFPV